jgi:hypothetical protein
VQIVTTPQDVDAQGTVAHGSVIVDGARFGYREVRWSIEDETAANLAANRWAAAWDWQLVAEALIAIGDDELRTLTGFEDHELKNLMAADWSKPQPGSLLAEADKSADHAVHLTAAQYDLLTAAKAAIDPTGMVSDAGAIELMCRRILERVE